MNLTKEVRHEAYKYALKKHYEEVKEVNESSPCVHIRDGAGLRFWYFETPKHFEEFALFLPGELDRFMCDDGKDLGQIEIALMFCIEMTA